MGGAASHVIRSCKNWNVLNRAIRQTEKDKIKPRAAPKILSPSEANLNLNVKILNEKNRQLEESIQKFNITSSEVIEFDRIKTKSHRPLPQKYLSPHPTELEFTALEPVIIPEGKLTVPLLVELLQSFREDITIEQLADKYNLPPEKVFMILRYIRLFVPNAPPDVLRSLQQNIPQPSFFDNLLFPEGYGKKVQAE